MIDALKTRGDMSTVTMQRVMHLALVALAEWSGSVLRALLDMFNAVTARQARRYQDNPYLFF